MSKEHEGFLRHSLHAFVKGFFATCGVWLAFIPLIILIGMIAASGRGEISIPGKFIVLPSADGEREALATHTPVVLQIDIDGIIRPEKVAGVSAAEVETQLLHSREGALHKDRVKAILLNINTPGGGALEADRIYRSLIAYKKRYDVPIYAFVSGLCASGGMYIASAADKVYSNPTGLIGSVGVIANFFNVSQTLEKVGVDPKTLYDGKGKDQMNPFRPWTPQDFQETQVTMNYLYDRFVDIVAEARPRLTREQLIDEYGARLFAAPTALEHGYIDKIVFDRNEALAALVEEAGVTDDYQVVKFEEHRGIAELISAQSPLLGGEIKHQIDLPDALTLNGYLYLYQPGL